MNRITGGSLTAAGVYRRAGFKNLFKQKRRADLRADLAEGRAKLRECPPM